jgi:uncharacterized OB-fold protein
MTDELPDRPLPEMRNFGAEYWRSAARGVLSVPKCDRCGQTFWHPRPRCPHCGSQDVSWIASMGTGEIHTFTIVRQSGAPFFKTRVPYAVAMILLDEGARVMSNVVGVDVDAVHIGMRVSAVFEPVGEGLAIPLFEPSSS